MIATSNAFRRASPRISSADAVYNLTFILATVVALHNTFLHLKDFVRLYYVEFDNHDDRLIAISVSLVMSYMFIRIYIVLHDIDERFDSDPLTGTTNRFSKGVERLIRILLFFLVLFCLKPVQFEFLDDLWSRWYFLSQRYGEDFSLFMAGLIYDQNETMNLIARMGSDMWVNLDAESPPSYPPRFGVLVMLIAVLFMLWDAVSLVGRDYAKREARVLAWKQRWPFGDEDRYPAPSSLFRGRSGHATYMATKYLNRIHGLHNLYQAPLTASLTHAQIARCSKVKEGRHYESSRFSWIMWRIGALLLQLMAYLTSLKLLERLCLFAFGLVLTASFNVQPHISMTLLALFGLSSIALSAYQYRIGGQLIHAIMKPFVFVFGQTLGPFVCLIGFLVLLFFVLSPSPNVQRDYWIYAALTIGTMLALRLIAKVREAFPMSTKRAPQEVRFDPPTTARQRPDEANADEEMQVSSAGPAS